MKLFEPAPRMSAASRYGAVGWLSFLLAIAATGVFFSVLDPFELAPCLPFPEVSRMTAYSIGFLLFWLFAAAAGCLAVLFTYPERGAGTDRATGIVSRED